MTKLAIIGMAALLATSAMAADLPLKRAAPQPYPDYPPQAQATPVPQPFPQPFAQGFPPGGLPFVGGPPPVNPCISQAGFPLPLPLLGLGLGRGFAGGGHHR